MAIAATHAHWAICNTPHVITYTVRKSNRHFRDITRNVEKNEILYEIFRAGSRFPRWILCYFSGKQIPLGQCRKENSATITEPATSWRCLKPSVVIVYHVHPLLYRINNNNLYKFRCCCIAFKTQQLLCTTYFYCLFRLLQPLDFCTAFVVIASSTNSSASAVSLASTCPVASTNPEAPLTQKLH